jgi:hypothetical protein
MWYFTSHLLFQGKKDEVVIDSMTDLLLGDNQFLGLDLTSDVVL